MSTTRRKSDLWTWWSNKTRDFVLFAAGLAGVAYETLVKEVDRPALLAVFAGMMGLPAFLRRDERDEPKGTVPDDDADSLPRQDA